MEFLMYYYIVIVTHEVLFNFFYSKYVFTSGFTWSWFCFEAFVIISYIPAGFFLDLFFFFKSK